MPRIPFHLCSKTLELGRALSPLRLLASIAVASLALHPLILGLHLPPSENGTCKCGACFNIHHIHMDQEGLPVLNGSSGAKHHDPAECPVCKLIGHLSDMQALAVSQGVFIPSHYGTSPLLKPCIVPAQPLFNRLPPSRAPPA